MSRAPVVAIMGRPNVGKSTLMNRITETMDAIVDPAPGVTRDRKYAFVRWKDRLFQVVDTGGVGIESGDWLSIEVERQAFFAADEADLVVMVADVKTGVTGDDEYLASKLKKMKQATLLAVNKVDNPGRELEVGRFYELGLGEPLAVSAYHGLGTGDLLDRIAERLPPWEQIPEEKIAVAIVGGPNVGKSSILNRIAGEERAVVCKEPHTTRDTIDTVVEFEGTSYRILDTAGIRRKRLGGDDVEYYSGIRTFRTIDRADVVLLVTDAGTGPGENDQKIARKIDSRGRASLLVVNKWDLVADEGESTRLMEAVAYKFRFADHLPLLRTSALTGRGIEKVLPLVKTAYGEWQTRIPTPALNDFLSEVKNKRNPPRKGGKQLKMYYATQPTVAPPTVIIFVNDAGLVKPDYRRFLQKQLRERYGFWGSPLRIHFRTAT